jgi:hypothetical protein
MRLTDARRPVNLDDATFWTAAIWAVGDRVIKPNTPCANPALNVSWRHIGRQVPSDSCLMFLVQILYQVLDKII